MTAQEYIDLILAHTAMRNLTVKGLDADSHLQLIAMPEDQKRSAVQAYIPVVLLECLTVYDFDFVCDWTTYSGGTVANQATYKCSGKLSDCRAVTRVLYGANELVLEFVRQADMDTKLSGLERPDTVAYWTSEIRQDGFPVIRLIGTPIVGSEQIKYRYRLKSVEITQWPEEHTWVIISGVVAKFVPEFESMHRAAINKMIAFYNPVKSSAQPAPINTALARLNRERNQRHGY